MYWQCNGERRDELRGAAGGSPGVSSEAGPAGVTGERGASSKIIPERGNKMSFIVLHLLLLAASYSTSPTLRKQRFADFLILLWPLSPS